VEPCRIGQVDDLPVPDPGERPVSARIRELDALVGRTRFVEVCIELLQGADRAAYVPELRYLTGHHWSPGDPVRDPAVWKDYWVRTWGARGLLHCWHDMATPAVVAGLSDDHYRPAEMCLKVSARHEVAGSGPGAARLTRSALPRVRANAVRTLGAVGDTDHVADVLAALRDPEEGVRGQAARAYERMAARLELPSLEAALIEAGEPDGSGGP
jgi:HEAT repeats